jgi:hypothetical protein
MMDLWESHLSDCNSIPSFLNDILLMLYNERMEEGPLMQFSFQLHLLFSYFVSDT